MQIQKHVLQERIVVLLEKFNLNYQNLKKNKQIRRYPEFLLTFILNINDTCQYQASSFNHSKRAN